MRGFFRTLILLFLFLSLFYVSGCKEAFIEYEEFAPFENKLTKWFENGNTFKIKLDIEIHLNYSSSAYDDEYMGMDIQYKISQSDKYYEFYYFDRGYPKVIVKEYDGKYFIHQIDKQYNVITVYNPDTTNSLDFSTTSTDFSKNMKFRKISENHYQVSSSFSNFGLQIDDLKETLSELGLTENDLKNINVNLELILDEDNNTLKFNYEILNFKFNRREQRECKIDMYYEMFFYDYNQPFGLIDITKTPYKLSPATSFENVFKTMDANQPLVGTIMDNSTHYFRVRFESGLYNISKEGTINVKFYDENRNEIDLIYDENTRSTIIPEGNYYINVSSLYGYSFYKVNFNKINN